MKIYAIKCLDCGDTVYSRARHDFRSCSCGNVFIDGGFDYTWIGVKGPYEHKEIEIATTKEILYDDWATGKDKFGLIRSGGVNV